MQDSAYNFIKKSTTALSLASRRYSRKTKDQFGFSYAKKIIQSSSAINSRNKKNENKSKDLMHSEQDSKTLKEDLFEIQIPQDTFIQSSNNRSHIQQRAKDSLYQLSLTELNIQDNDPSLITGWDAPLPLFRMRNLKQSASKIKVLKTQDNTKENSRNSQIITTPQRFNTKFKLISQQESKELFTPNRGIKHLRWKQALGRRNILQDYSNLLGREKILHL